jgi:hypothetical protein
LKQQNWNKKFKECISKVATKSMKQEILAIDCKNMSNTVTRTGFINRNGFKLIEINGFSTDIRVNGLLNI